MSRKKRDEETVSSKPFFARYLEGQDTEASAKVGERGSLGYKKAGPILQTLKFPSDSDELNYCPYYRSEADVPEKYRDAKIVTLKYPSDRDEWVYNAEYTSKAAAPKGNVAGAKEGTVKLKKRSTTLKKK